MVFTLNMRQVLHGGYGGMQDVILIELKLN